MILEGLIEVALQCKVSDKEKQGSKDDENQRKINVINEKKYIFAEEFKVGYNAKVALNLA